MSSTEVAAPVAAPLPDLVRPQAAANQLDINDVTLPRIYRGESQSNAVKEGDVPQGVIYVAQGADDPNPQVIAEPAAKGEAVGPSIRAHFIGVKKGLALREDNELRTWAWGDPSAPVDAKVTYDFTLCLPQLEDEDDREIPVKLIMDKSSTGTAKRINFALLKLDDPARWPEKAFDLALKRREKTEGGSKQVWYVWVATEVEAEEADVEVAEKVAAMLGGAAGDVTPPPPPAQPDI